MAAMDAQVHAGRRTYAVVIVRDGEGYSAFVPALPGCFSQGATPDDAAENVKEAIDVHIAGLEADGEPVPEEPGLLVRVVTV